MKSAYKYLFIDTIIALAPAITFYGITCIFVYAGSAPAWAPRAVGAIVWGLAFTGCLFLQSANPGDHS